MLMGIMGIAYMIIRSGGSYGTRLMQTKLTIVTINNDCCKEYH